MEGRWKSNTHILHTCPRHVCAPPSSLMRPPSPPPSTTTPLHLPCFFFFLHSADPNARLYAAAVPAANLLRLVAVGAGVVRDAGTVKSMSREGDRCVE